MSERKTSLDMLEAALRYASVGIHVFPCGGDDGKKPRTHHGHTDATTDEATIRKWWTRWPNANIGAVPGLSGHCVLDVDPWRNGDEREVIARWEKEHGLLPGSLVVESGQHLNRDTGELARGQHRWFRWPENVPAFTKLVKDGVEIKGNGGYVLMPPSTHATGVRYEIARGDFETIALAGSTAPTKRCETSSPPTEAVSSTSSERSPSSLCSGRSSTTATSNGSCEEAEPPRSQNGGWSQQPTICSSFTATGPPTPPDKTGTPHPPRETARFGNPNPSTTTHPDSPTASRRCSSSVGVLS